MAMMTMDILSMSEHQEQTALFSAIRQLNIPDLEWLFAIPNGGLRNVKVAAKLKREGVKAGVWDLLLPIPKGKYHGLFIEMKYGKNKLTDNQQCFGQFVKEQGYQAKVAYDWEQAFEVIREYMRL